MQRFISPTLASPLPLRSSELTYLSNLSLLVMAVACCDVLETFLRRSRSRSFLRRSMLLATGVLRLVLASSPSTLAVTVTSLHTSLYSRCIGPVPSAEHLHNYRFHGQRSSTPDPEAKVRGTATIDCGLWAGLIWASKPRHAFPVYFRCISDGH